MNPVYAAFLQAVRSLFLTETRRIAGHSIRKFLLRNNRINEFSDHGMLAGADQIQIFSFDLVHHGVHLRKTHNAGHHIAANHKRRHTVGKAAANHKISRIRDDGGVKPCNISHEIIKSVSCHPAGTVQINAAETLHDLRMVGNLKIRNDRLSVFLDFHIFTVIFSDGYAGINDVRNRHHDFRHLFVQFLFLNRKLLQTGSIRCHLFFYLFRFVSFSLAHQSADLLGELIPLRAQLVRLLLSGPSLRIQADDLIHQRKLLILKFIFNILLYNIRIFPDKF